MANMARRLFLYPFFLHFLPACPRGRGVSREGEKRRGRKKRQKRTRTSVLPQIPSLSFFLPSYLIMIREEE